MFELGCLGLFAIVALIWYLVDELLLARRCPACTSKMARGAEVCPHCGKDMLIR